MPKSKMATTSNIQLVDDNMKKLIPFYVWEFEKNKRTSSDKNKFTKWIESFGWGKSKQKEHTKTIANSPQEFRILEDKLGFNNNKDYIIIRTNKYTEGIRQVGLDESTLKEGKEITEKMFIAQKYIVDVNLNESAIIISQETRIEALFTVIRNAIAHNNYAYLNKEFILLESKTKGNTTGKICIKTETLINWITIFKNK